VVKRKTASNRLTRAITKITEWCRRNRHKPLIEQQAKLRQKLQGHYNYYGITGNSASLSKFYHFATRVWKKWLSRRNRERRWNWDCHRRMMKRYPLPEPVTVHSVLRQQRNHNWRNRMR